jgi:hypothetical protein
VVRHRNQLDASEKPLSFPGRMGASHGICHPIEPGLHRVEDPFVFQRSALAYPAYTWA